MKFSIPVQTLSRVGAVMLASALLAPAALAGPILAQNALIQIEKNPDTSGLDPITDPMGNPIGAIDYGDGQLLLHDYDDDPLDTFSPNPSWWNAPGVAYTTHTAGIIVEFENINVTGFTFNIGANKNAQAWIKAYYDDGTGNIDSLQTNWFQGIGPSSTPSYGVSLKNPSNSCANITKIEIDPQFVWGIGNFAITDAGSCASVPEPSSTALMSLSLLALGFGHLWYRNREQKLAITAS